MNGSVKHLNPRQGITTDDHPTARHGPRRQCETPKSPPGDYNILRRETHTQQADLRCVKHLNPRQGITTRRRRSSGPAPIGSACETPKSPPGDYNAFRDGLPSRNRKTGVKHLNPRQGITTPTPSMPLPSACSDSVKHLNPRQGITTHTTRTNR